MRAKTSNLLRRRAPLRSLLAIAMLMLAGQANAEWKVTDRDTHTGLDTLDKTIREETNKRLEQIRDQEKIGMGQKSADGDPDAPKEVLPEDRPTNAVVDSKATRCPKSESAVANSQNTICEEIVKTELAQYNYALAMREVALKRQKRLNDIESARAKLKETDAGKLQSNSNELLALLARMESDRQQYRTYMDAYAARLTHLRALHEALGNQALNGRNKSMISDAVGGLAGLATLKGLLEVEQSSKKSGNW